jgi:lipopolysaccharide export system protein LptA
MIPIKASAGWWSALALACVGVAGPAAAQIDTRSNAPIDITADQAEVIQSKCEAIWRGAAEVLQEHARLRADTITVFSRQKPAATSTM